MAVNGTFPKSRKQLQVQGFLDLNKFRMNSTEEVFVMGLLSPPPCQLHCQTRATLPNIPHGKWIFLSLYVFKRRRNTDLDLDLAYNSQKVIILVSFL